MENEQSEEPICHPPYNGTFRQRLVYRTLGEDLLSCIPKMRLGKTWWSRLLLFPIVYPVIILISLLSVLFVIVSFPFSFLLYGMEI
jgi:hypothetical protein